MLYGNHGFGEGFYRNDNFDDSEIKFEKFSKEPSSIDKFTFSDSVVTFFTFLRIASMDPKKQSIDDFVAKYEQYTGYEKHYENEYVQNLANVYSFLQRNYGAKRLSDANKLLSEGKVERSVIDLFMDEGFIKNHPADYGLAYDGVLKGYPAYRILRVLDDFKPNSIKN